MKFTAMLCALSCLGVVALAGCGSKGSCNTTSPTGLRFCEEFAGELFAQDITQNICSAGNGTWSDSPCAQENTLGTCEVAPVGTGHAQTVYDIYYAGAAAGQPAPSTLDAQAACGLAGGTFSSGD